MSSLDKKVETLEAKLKRVQDVLMAKKARTVEFDAKRKPAKKADKKAGAKKPAAKKPAAKKPAKKPAAKKVAKRK